MSQLGCCEKGTIERQQITPGHEASGNDVLARLLGRNRGDVTNRVGIDPRPGAREIEGDWGCGMEASLIVEAFAPEAPAGGTFDGTGLEIRPAFPTALAPTVPANTHGRLNEGQRESSRGGSWRTLVTHRKKLPSAATGVHMRDEEEIREQYVFLTDQLESDEMRHEGIRQMFTYYKRALGWVLEEEFL